MNLIVGLPLISIGLLTVYHEYRYCHRAWHWTKKYPDNTDIMHPYIKIAQFAHEWLASIVELSLMAAICWTGIACLSVRSTLSFPLALEIAEAVAPYFLGGFIITASLARIIGLAHLIHEENDSPAPLKKIL